MSPTTTVTPTEHGLNSDAFLEDRAVGAHYPKPSSPPGEVRLTHLLRMMASASADATTSDKDDDDITQSDTDDGSGSSSDGTGPEMEALEKEIGRYVPRTQPSKPAVGAQASNSQRSQSKATNAAPQPSSTKSGRPLAVTATGKTTAPGKKK